MGRCGTIALLAGTIWAAPVLGKDLPRSAPPRGQSGCEAMGPGFEKVEGSETCIKVSGSVSAEFSYSSGGGAAGSPASSR